eukprot:1152256-Pelagomonas_calceolata.AAC.3
MICLREIEPMMAMFSKQQQYLLGSSNVCHAAAMFDMQQLCLPSSSSKRNILCCIRGAKDCARHHGVDPDYCSLLDKQPASQLDVPLQLDAPLSQLLVSQPTAIHTPSVLKVLLLFHCNQSASLSCRCSSMFHPIRSLSDSSYSERPLKGENGVFPAYR